MNRMALISVGTLLTMVWLLSTGCTGSIFRPQSPEDSLFGNEEPQITLVGDVAHPYGLGYMKVESIALITGLAGTGEDPAPSPQRAAILAEMNRREVDQPNQILASPSTSLVAVRGFLRPGIQKGERFDVEVRTTSQSDTTSLRDGWLMENYLTEMAVLGSKIRKGHVMATSLGNVLVDPSANATKSPELTIKGQVLGGGVTRKSRSLGLIIDTEKQSARLSQQLGKTINHRFHTYVDGRQAGIANPKTDEFIEILPHPRYKDNVGRFMRVIRNIAIREIPAARQARLILLEDQLLDPLTTAIAAVRLEAIGDDQAIEILEKGLLTEDPEIRFYSSEALAYLDVTKAVEPLAQAARDEPALRVNALAALSTMDDAAAYEALRNLMDTKSAETRYGAFRALWTMSPNDPFVHGEMLGDQFSYHQLDVEGPSMIHVTKSHRSEVVLFGKEHIFQLPLVADAGKNILVNGLSGAKITISRFDVNAPTKQRTVSTNVDEVIRAIVDLGGSYPDVVQLLQQAKESGSLASRFRVDALPETGRQFLRSADSLEASGSNASSAKDRENPDNLDTVQSEPYELATPQSELFGRK
jgi:flagellar basal body P-ring protein FlgI